MPKKKLSPASEELNGVSLGPDNPNHHLWNNHGTWFLHYTSYPTSLTKERVRRSLGTKDLATARRRRDLFFASPAGRAAKLDATGKAVAA